MAAPRPAEAEGAASPAGATLSDSLLSPPPKQQQSWSAQLLAALHIVLPTALGNALEYLPVCTGIIFIGHLHDAKLALDAVALARAAFNLVAMAPGFGAISPLRTLCPQAVGAGKPALCGLYLQRALLAMIAFALPAVALLVHLEPLLGLAGQPADAARLARPYALWLLPQYVGVVGMSAIQRIFQALGYNWANFGITALVCAVAPLLQQQLVARCGYLGAAWAASAYNLLYLVLQVPYLCYKGHSQLFVPQRAVLGRAGLLAYWRLMWPGFLMVVSEWWVIEALVFLSGLLHSPSTTLAAFAIINNLQTLALMAWIGLAVAAATLTGKAIGAGAVREAQRAAAVVLVLGMSLALTLVLPLAALRKPLASAYSSVDSVDELTASLLLVACR